MNEGLFRKILVLVIVVLFVGTSGVLTITSGNEAIDSMKTAGIAVTKTPDVIEGYPGDVVNYTIVVTNTGDDTLYDVYVNDTTLGISYYIDSLAAGESKTYYVEHTLASEPDPFENCVEAEGYDALGERYSDCDCATVDIIPEEFNITVEKTVKWDCTPPFKDVVEAHVGEWVTFKIYVNNTGNTPLNITVKDALPEGLNYRHGTANHSEVFEQSQNILYWNFTSVQPQTSIEITFVADIEECGNLVNLANVTGVYDCYEVYAEDTATVICQTSRSDDSDAELVVGDIVSPPSSGPTGSYPVIVNFTAFTVNVDGAIEPQEQWMEHDNSLDTTGTPTVRFYTACDEDYMYVAFENDTGDLYTAKIDLFIDKNENGVWDGVPTDDRFIVYYGNQKVKDYNGDDVEDSLVGWNDGYGVEIRIPKVNWSDCEDWAFNISYLCAPGRNPSWGDEGTPMLPTSFLMHPCECNVCFKALVSISKLIPGDFVTIYHTDFENPANVTNEWIAYSLDSESDTWTISGKRSHSYFQSYRCTGRNSTYLSNAHDILEMRHSVDLSYANNVTFSFWHWCKGDSYDLNGHLEIADYGDVEISNDDGVTWISLSDLGVSELYYNNDWMEASVTIESTNTYPGNISGADLLSNQVKFRFVWRSDPQFQYEGWYIDDVSIVVGEKPSTELVFQTSDIPCMPFGSTLIYTFSIPWVVDEEGKYLVEVLTQEDPPYIGVTYSSKIVSIGQPPTIEITSPEENEVVSGTTLIQGIASDPDGDETLERVEVKIDEGSWETATGTTSWSYSWDTTTVNDGEHTIYARSYDGEDYTNPPVSVVINVDNTVYGVYGIDVSHYQGDIDWNLVHNAGYNFAFVKATEGEGWTGDPQAKDDYFERNMKDGVAAGMLMGAYHLARPDLNLDGAVDEAKWFVHVARNYITTGYLRPALDLERGEDLDTETLSRWVHDWMNTVEIETGVQPILYVNPSYASHLDDSVGQYNLWLAHHTCDKNIPPNVPEQWKNWDFWQYYDPGVPGEWVCGPNDPPVPGIPSGNVDLDVFNGDLSKLDNFIIKKLGRRYVPHFSQRDDAWKGDYIKKENGDDCDTIGNIGCAMTSTAMILKYYGVDTDPGRLNSWLNENNGYFTCSDGECGCLDWSKPAEYSNGKVTWIDNTGEWTWYFLDDQEIHWNKLHEELEKGYPVIVYVDYPQFGKKPDHFVLVTDFRGGNIINPGNYYVNDPWNHSFDPHLTLSYYHDTTYDNTFFGMRFYHGSPETIRVDMGSSAELQVYDSENRVTGLVNGEVMEEIPNSVYYNSTETVTLFLPNDYYRYRAVGIENGTYRLTIEYLRGGNESLFSTGYIPISTGVIHQYTVNWDVLFQGEDGVTLQIDKDGDGAFEQTITSDSELTHDEFLLKTETKITKPEKALYIANNEILSLFTPLIIGPIDIEVNVPNELDIIRVEFYIDNKLKANDTTGPYVWTWSEKTFGKRTIKVVAYDNVGNHVSKQITVWKFF